MQDFKFIPFQSCVDTSFWVKLNDLKVDEYKLDESNIDIYGFLDICQTNQTPCTIFLDGNSFSKNLEKQNTKLCIKGKLIIKNTLEAFNIINKKELLTTYGQDIYRNIENEQAILQPNFLCTFVILCFADIKKYKYLYWVAIPSMSFPSCATLKESPCLLSKVIDEMQLINLEKQYVKWLLTSPIDSSDEILANQIYFSLCIDETLQFIIQPLSLCELFDKNCNLSNYISGQKVIWLGFFDNSSIPKPCDQDKPTLYYPGWLMRNLISMCAIRLNKLAKSPDIPSNNIDSKETGDIRHDLDKININIIAFKLTKNEGEINKTLYSISNASMCYKFEFKLDGSIYEPKYMGWESNQNGQLCPKSIDLSNLLDPIEIASSSAKLNVKLMKWRALPELNLEKIFPLKCLLIGAGTLGCNVARCLLAWGITHITLIDNGTISYSNPVRQSLYTFADALPNNDALNNKSRNKAVLAAKALAQIFPKVVAKGYDFTVRSPGHPVSEGEFPEISAEIDLLESLIEQHDAIFLLTDSRESRWLPTVIGALYGKVVITTALGFDSFLVMRHGTRTVSADHKSKSTIGTVPGCNLGCYYCNDVIAPTDSTANRSLDQQCTVTRPGVSYLASGLAVEMFISLIQHPLGADAPARANAGNGNDCESNQDENIESCLGIVPHQIRGFLSNFSTFQPLTLAFDKCTACSKSVLDAYKSSEKMKFLINVFNSPPSFLEDFTGLSELLNGTKANDLMTLSSSSGSDIS